MGTYSVSEETKRALIQAGGELFAERGFDTVSVRDITSRAGVKVNAISYHFGGKEKFMRAVIDYALKDGRRYDVAAYPLENSHLFETRDGKCQIVRDLIDLFFRQLCPEDQLIWINVISLRAVVTNHSMKEYIVKRLLMPIRKVFVMVYQKITGNMDVISAYCWFMNIASAPIIFATNLSTLMDLPVEGNVDWSVYRRIQHQVTENALFGLGLLNTERN